MKGSEIVDLVIVKLEEKSAFLNKETQNRVLTGGDNIDELKPVYSYIDAHIAEAGNEVLLAAPLNRITPISVEYGKLEPFEENADGSGKIYLSPDFLRLYTLKMTDWLRPVHKAITKTDHLYTLQHNKFTKGTPQKPVAVFSGVRGYYDDYVCANGAELFDSATRVDTFSEISNNSMQINKNGEVKYKKDDESEKTTTDLPYLEYYSILDNHTIEELSYVPHFRLSLDYNRDVAEAIALNTAKKVMEVFGNSEGIVLLDNELKSVLTNMQL